jgi:hypothetical protein
MCLNDCVLPEDVLNEAEQASNSLIIICLEAEGRHFEHLLYLVLVRKYDWISS